jgi:hypothetical protein
MNAQYLVIHYRLIKALYSVSTPFGELEQIWSLIEYLESAIR